MSNYFDDGVRGNSAWQRCISQHIDKHHLHAIFTIDVVFDVFDCLCWWLVPFTIQWMNGLWCIYLSEHLRNEGKCNLTRFLHSPHKGYTNILMRRSVKLLLYTASLPFITAVVHKHCRVGTNSLQELLKTRYPLSASITFAINVFFQCPH